ncbi:MAG: hypothetical protein QM689_08725 [Oscillospiraceae bacterium]
MKKSDLDKLRKLYNEYVTKSEKANKHGDPEYVARYLFCARTICEVLEVLDGISYEKAVYKIMEDTPC